MAEFKVGRDVSADGAEEPAALGLDRTLVTRDFILQMKLEGRVFYAQQGDAGTKLNFAATTYDEDRPQFAIQVPTGILCIPLALNITLEDVTNTENHIIWSKTDNLIGIGASTALTPVNYRRDNLYPPTCTARSLYTGDATAASNIVEVHRWFHPFASAAVTDADLHNHRWDYRDPDMPLLLGPMTIQMHIYGTAGPQGFGEYTWIEIPTSELGLLDK